MMHLFSAQGWRERILSELPLPAKGLQPGVWTENTQGGTFTAHRSAYVHVHVHIDVSYTDIA